VSLTLECKVNTAPAQQDPLPCYSQHIHTICHHLMPHDQQTDVGNLCVLLCARVQDYIAESDVKVLLPAMVPPMYRANGGLNDYTLVSLLNHVMFLTRTCAS
jgi:hypothetical protein